MLRRSLFKLLLLRRRELLRNLRRIDAEQWEDINAMNAVQNERLRCLLLHAYHSVPYYKKIFSADDIDRIINENPKKALANLPVLTKRILRNHFEGLISKDLGYRKWFNETSGGSTGEPVRLIQDFQFTEWRDAVKLLFDKWTGYRLSAPKVAIWGSERDILNAKLTTGYRLYRWLKNQTAFNAYEMSDKKMGVCVEHLNKKKPELIFAYAESIYELSRYIERKGLSVHRPKAVMTSAGILFPHMKVQIEKVFGCKIFNRYGSREVGDIACECNQGIGLHVSMPTHLIEIIRDDGCPVAQGEKGYIIVTLLSNFAMPLIRYRIEDIGAWAESSCSCGRKWPMLKEVYGRVTDNFVKKDGTLVYGAYFRHLLFYKYWIKKYQIVQEDLTLIRFRIVPDKNVADWEAKFKQNIEEINKGVQMVMGTDCRTEFELIDRILPSPSGKYLYTLSKVKEGREKTI